MGSKNIIGRAALFVLIVLVVVTGFFIFSGESLVSDYTVTGKAVYNKPLTTEQLAEGVILTKGRNVITWTNEIDKKIPVEEALKSVVEYVKEVYGRSEGRYWYPKKEAGDKGSSGDEDKQLKFFAPWNKYEISMKKKGILTYLIKKETVIILPDGNKIFPKDDEIVCVDTKGVVDNELVCKEKEECSNTLVEQGEILEGDTKVVNGLTIKLTSTDETNFVLKVEITIDDGRDFTLTSDENPIVKFKIVEGSYVSYYTLELVSASDNSATIEVKNYLCSVDTYVEECTDSDGGINYFVKGSIKVTKKGFTEIFDDICGLNINNIDYPDKLGEIYCNGNIYGLSVYDCPNGCGNGACL